MRIGVDARCLETPKPTGVARYMKNLLVEWNKLKINHEVYLYARSTTFKDLDIDNFQLRLLDPNNLFDPVVIEQLILPKLASKDSMDLLFSPEYTSPVSNKVKRVMTLHDISYSTHPEWYSLSERVRLNSFSRLSAMRALAILTDSEFSKAEIARHYRIPPNKVNSIPLAAESKCIPMNEGDIVDKVRLKYGLDKPYVLFMASIFSRRKVSMLIKAFSKIAKDVPHKLVIIGRNFTRPFEDIDSLAKEVGIYKRYVREDFVGEEDVVPLLSMADVFVYVSTYEGFGLPPLEAMSCGTSVISSNVTSIPEVVGDAGILIDPEDENALIDALSQLLTDEKLRESLSQKGLVRSKQFSWRRTAQETLDIIEKLIGEAF